MILGKYSSSSSSSSSSRNIIPRAGGPWKEESYLHLGDPDYGREVEEGRRILFMDLMRKNDKEEEEEEDRGACSIVFKKEHMFDKVVTPSDVGKLNRLVIPKQYAEKYFPLDSSNCEKRLLLNFEDRTGKQWRFRYSYWNSSQSYVMTKGWSRFVKEMKLNAGDVVSFSRRVGDLGKDSFFIEWRRRTHPFDPLPVARNHLHLFPGHSVQWDQLPAPKDYLWLSRTNERPNHHHLYSLGSPVGRIYAHGYGETPMAVATSNYGAYDKFYHAREAESPPVAQAKAVAATKSFRLFGVNMEFADLDSNIEDNSPPPDLMLFDSVPVPSMTRFVSKGKASMSLDLEL